MLMKCLPLHDSFQIGISFNYFSDMNRLIRMLTKEVFSNLKKNSLADKTMRKHLIFGMDDSGHWRFREIAKWVYCPQCPAFFANLFYLWHWFMILASVESQNYQLHTPYWYESKSLISKRMAIAISVQMITNVMISLLTIILLDRYYY